jgi:hypothetical protein
MRRLLSRRLAGALCIAALAALALFTLEDTAHTAQPKTTPDKAAVERARTTVRMLDDLHKGYVVNITAIYVGAQEKTPAARVAKRVMKHMQKNGWGSGRLVDATGSPVNENNAPRTAFEKRAVAKLKAGKKYYDEVATVAGKPVLRAATVVPVVMNQCIACHPGHKKGDLLGSLVYEIPIK